MPEELNKKDEESFVTIDATEANVAPEENKVVKEYEKLLFQDESRLKGVKALRLVKMGCFDQYKKAPNEMDFNELKKQDGAKVYKNHELYERMEDGTFFYIQSENEETAEGEKKVYRYDVIEVDNVDDETFEKLCKAHAHEGNGLINTFFIGSIVCNIWGLIGIVMGFIYYFVDEKESFAYAFFKDIANAVILYSVSLAVLVVAIICKRNHEEK